MGKENTPPWQIMGETKNPAKPLEAPPKFTGEGGEKAGGWSPKLQKWRENWMKLYQASVGKPLTQAQISIIRKRLDEILPHLQRIPDHPPYAWMIEDAIQGLAEEGGSSKEAIAEYIKKENKDLPWAHETLLTHHLNCLCESGDIVLTSNQQYALPSSHSDLSSRKNFRKEPARRMKDWDWNKKKNERQKRKSAKDHLEERNDEAQVICEERSSCEPENLKGSKQVHEMQIVDICSSDAQMNSKAHQLDAEVDLIHEDRPQIVDICSSDAQMNSKAHQLDAEVYLIHEDRPPCDLSSRKNFRKEPARRMKDWDWNKKKNKRQKRKSGKDHLEERNDEAQLICEERSSCEPENLKGSKQVPEMQIVDICSSDAQMNPKAHQLDAEVDLIHEDRPPCDLSSRKNFRKEPARRMKDWDWNKKKNKRQKRNSGKDHLEERNDEAQLICEERSSCEPENLKGSKQVHEMQIVDICSLDAQMNSKAHQLDAEVDLIHEDRPPCDSEQHKGSKADSKMHIVDIYSSNVGLDPDEQHFDDVQTDNPSQPSPPCFEPVLKIIDARKRPEEFAAVAPKLLCRNGEEMRSSVDDGLKHIQRLPLEVSATKNHGEEQICSQLKIQEFNPTTDKTYVPESQHVSLRGENQGPRIVYQYKKRPPREKGKAEKTKDLDGPIQVCSELKIQELEPTTDKTIPESQHVSLRGANQGPRIVYQYERRLPRKKGKADQIKEQQQLQKYEHDDHRQLDEKTGEPLTLGLRQPQDTELKDTNELQELSWRGKRFRTSRGAK